MQGAFPQGGPGQDRWGEHLTGWNRGILTDLGYILVSDSIFLNLYVGENKNKIKFGRMKKGITRWFHKLRMNFYKNAIYFVRTTNVSSEYTNELS
jgi:hypothetical protein